MNLTCPSCRAVYRIDPARIPAGGARTRCTRCNESFLLHRDGAVTLLRTREGPAVPGAAVTTASTAATAPRREPAGGDARAGAPVGGAAEPPRPQSAHAAAAPGSTPRATGAAPGLASGGARTVAAPGTKKSVDPPSPRTGAGQEAPSGGAPSRPAAPHPFLVQDPDGRARRFARALVSDIVAYAGDALDGSRRAGTLKKDFREEILKSWEEYTEQVGSDFAKSTPHFREALNDILAEGQQVF